MCRARRPPRLVSRNAPSGFGSALMDPSRASSTCIVNLGHPILSSFVYLGESRMPAANRYTRCMLLVTSAVPHLA